MDEPLFSKSIESLLATHAGGESRRPTPFSMSRGLNDGDRPPEELVSIASLQRQIIRNILFSLAWGFFAAILLTGTGRRGDDSLATVFSVVAFGLQMIGFVLTVLLPTKLYRTLGIVLATVASLLPCISVIAVLVVNARATSALRRNGIRVGLLGARKADLPRVDAI